MSRIARTLGGRLAELSLALGLLVILSPLLLLLCAAFAAGGEGPLRRVARVGRGGAEFGMFAFPETRRLPPFLSALRRLPALLNVLGGSMALLGPRPVGWRELEGEYRLSGIAAAYLAVKPGILRGAPLQGRPLRVPGALRLVWTGGMAPPHPGRRMDPTSPPARLASGAR